MLKHLLSLINFCYATVFITFSINCYKTSWNNAHKIVLIITLCRRYLIKIYSVATDDCSMTRSLKLGYGDCTATRWLLVNSRTNQIADWSTRGLDNSWTMHWTTRGLIKVPICSIATLTLTTQ